MVSFANVASRLRAAVRQNDGLAIGGPDGSDVATNQFARSILERREGRQRDDSAPPTYQVFSILRFPFIFLFAKL